MKIIVFGASGKCGAHFVRLAASHGHEVTAFVREGTAFDAPANVRVIRGDVLSRDDVAAAIAGHDAVASGLGMRYAHPWAKRDSPDDFTSHATANIVAAMQAKGVRRLVFVSAAGVGDSRAAMNWPMRAMLATSNVGVAYADLERAEKILLESGLDFQAVRPTTLTNGSSGNVGVTGVYGTFDRIPRALVATFMLESIEAASIEDRTPMITLR
jgi:nucleoside-diphosphate-sugar epimerase